MTEEELLEMAEEYEDYEDLEDGEDYFDLEGMADRPFISSYAAQAAEAESAAEADMFAGPVLRVVPWLIRRYAPRLARYSSVILSAARYFFRRLATSRYTRGLLRHFPRILKTTLTILAQVRVQITFNLVVKVMAHATTKVAQGTHYRPQPRPWPPYGRPRLPQPRPPYGRPRPPMSRPYGMPRPPISRPYGRPRPPVSRPYGMPRSRPYGRPRPPMGRPYSLPYAPMRPPIRSPYGRSMPRARSTNGNGGMFGPARPRSPFGGF